MIPLLEASLDIVAGLIRSIWVQCCSALGVIASRAVVCVSKGVLVTVLNTKE